MPKISEFPSIGRKKLPVFICIEKSEESDIMLQMKELLEDMIWEISAKQECNADYEIEIGCYMFSKTKNFQYPDKLASLSEINISEIFEESADMTAVLTQLNTDLSRKTLLNDEVGYLMPWIIFLLDGRKKYTGKDAVEQLENNKWFRYAKRMAFMFREYTEPEGDILPELIYKEAMVNVESDRKDAIDLFGKIMRNVSVPMGSILPPSSLMQDRDSIVFADPLMEEDAWAWGDDWD